METATTQIERPQESNNTESFTEASNMVPPNDRNLTGIAFPGDDDPCFFPEWAYARRAWHQFQISRESDSMKNSKTQTQTRYEAAVEKTAEIRFAINNGDQTPELFRDWRHSLECLPVFDEKLYGRIRSLASEAWDTVGEKDILLIWKCLRNHSPTI